MPTRSIAATLGALVLFIPTLELAAQPKRGISARLQFMGTQWDRVSQGAQVAPDGRNDGQFRLTLQTEVRRSIVHVLLRSCDARGVFTGRAAWDTDAKRLWVVGVFRNGKALSAAGGKPMDTFRGQTTYDLFASMPTGGFKPGESFCALVTLAGGMGISARTVVTGPVTAELKYHGITEDRVGTGAQTRPDGRKDAQFSLTLDSGGHALDVTKIELSVSDQKGNTWRKTWDTQPGGNWVLGVDRGGKRLNPQGRPLRAPARGVSVFTLWAANDSWKDPNSSALRSYFTPGGYFTARVFTKTQPMVRTTIRLP